MSLAVIIFVAAAAVAVVKATGSDQAPGSEPDGSGGLVEPQQSQSQTSKQDSESTVSGTTEDELAESAESAESAQQQVEQQDSASQDQEQAESNQQDQADSAGQDRINRERLSVSAQQLNPLRGFIIPIVGACITEFEGHLPTSPRTYRNNGVHEGLDFYQWAACTAVDYGTPVLAAKAGVVVRADLDYVDITPADWERFIANNWEGEKILDELRGRQVWIDHGRGIVTRYAHLSVIADGIAVDVEVQQGDIIGYPGESGQQEVYLDSTVDLHLHFEIRIANGWLGQGETPPQARKLYLEAFGLAGE